MVDTTIRPSTHDQFSACVLVLCADANLSGRIVHWLHRAGLRVAEAADGYSASGVLEKSEIAAIVTDRLLPPWPGLEAFPILRLRHPKLTIIYTGNADVDYGAHSRAAGATHVLETPLRRQSVLNALPVGLAAA